MQKQKLTAAGCSYLVKLCKNANMCNHHSRSVIEKQSKYCILYLSYWYASLYFSVVQLKPTRGKSLLLVVAWIDTSGPNTGSIITPRYNVCSHLLHITVLQWLIQHMAGLPHTHEPKTHTLSHTHTYIKMSGAPLTTSDLVLFAGGCWISLLRRWYPVRTGNCLYMVEYFLWLLLETGTQRFFDFL